MEKKFKRKIKTKITVRWEYGDVFINFDDKKMRSTILINRFRHYPIFTAGRTHGTGLVAVRRPGQPQRRPVRHSQRRRRPRRGCQRRWPHRQLFRQQWRPERRSQWQLHGQWKSRSQQWRIQRWQRWRRRRRRRRLPLQRSQRPEPAVAGCAGAAGPRVCVRYSFYRCGGPAMGGWPGDGGQFPETEVWAVLPQCDWYCVRGISSRKSLHLFSRVTFTESPYVKRFFSLSSAIPPPKKYACFLVLQLNRLRKIHSHFTFYICTFYIWTFGRCSKWKPRLLT